MISLKQALELADGMDVGTRVRRISDDHLGKKQIIGTVEGFRVENLFRIEVRWDDNSRRGYERDELEIVVRDEYVLSNTPTTDWPESVLFRLATTLGHSVARPESNAHIPTITLNLEVLIEEVQELLAIIERAAAVLHANRGISPSGAARALAVLEGSK